MTRDEIRLALWGEDVHVDFERSANFCVRKLRAALDDDASAPRFIETVPTRGYRFIGVAERVSAENRGQPVPRWPWSAGGALKWVMAPAVLLGAIAGFLVGTHAPGALTPKIVVVPFHNETGTSDFDNIAKGISDAAVAQLARPDRMSHLRVIGNATDVFFSFRPRDMKAMGRALGAQYLVLGQLKKDRTHFRVIAHLIRVSDQTHVWATTFDRDALDLPAQSSIAEDIAKAVSAHM